MHILKVKYTEFTLQQFRLPNSLPNGLPACLPAVRPGSTMATAPDFSHNGNRIGFTKLLLVSIHLQIAYKKVRNLQIGINKLVG